VRGKTLGHEIERFRRGIHPKLGSYGRL
jgi:hypothetical protein